MHAKNTIVYNRYTATEEDSVNRKQQAYEYLKSAIISNAIPAGAPVREMEVAAELKMSRTPIREAMRELEAEGVLKSYPARGTFVMPLTPSDVEEIYELRSLLELWAIDRSFDRITEEELSYAEGLFNEAYKASCWEKWHQADRLLHRLIVEKSGNSRLPAFNNMLCTQMDRIRKVSAARDVSRLESSFREHMEIIALIRKRDLPKSREALRSHLRAVANSAIDLSKISYFDL